MKKLFYLIAVLFMVSCNQNESFEESSKHFRSLEEFNAFINEAVNESSALRTRAIDNVSSSSISPMECIKKAAIAKGLKFEVINEGTENEIISFASDNPYIVYKTIEKGFFVWRDTDLPLGNEIILRIIFPYSYNTLTRNIVEVATPTETMEGKHLEAWSASEILNAEANSDKTGINYSCSGAIVLRNPTTGLREIKEYSNSGEIIVPVISEDPIIVQKIARKAFLVWRDTYLPVGNEIILDITIPYTYNTLTERIVEVGTPTEIILGKHLEAWESSEILNAEVNSDKTGINYSCSGAIVLRNPTTGLREIKEYSDSGEIIVTPYSSMN